MRTRKTFFLSGLFSLWLISAVSYAVMPVIDATAVTKLVEELRELEKQTTKLKEQYTELTTQGLDIKKSLDSLTSLPASVYQWSNEQILSLMTDLNNQMQQYSHIAYSASNLDQQFKTYFPGYQSISNYQQQYQENVDDTMRTLNGALKTIGLNTDDFSTESSRLSALHNHVQGAVGQTQAMQAMGEMSEELVTQTQSLRQIVSAQANSEMAYYAEQVQKEASTKANLDKVLAAGSTTLPVYGSNPDDCFN